MRRMFWKILRYKKASARRMMLANQHDLRDIIIPVKIDTQLFNFTNFILTIEKMDVILRYSNKCSHLQYLGDLVSVLWMNIAVSAGYYVHVVMRIYRHVPGQALYVGNVSEGPVKVKTYFDAVLIMLNISVQ